MYKQVRYGTPFMPTTVKRVLQKFPGRMSIKPPQEEAQDSVSFMSARGTESVSKMTGVPSVSTIVGCTEPQDGLYQWQLQMINKLGMDGFRKMALNRMLVGTCFHGVVEALLKELASFGEIRSSVSEVATKDLEPYFVGLAPFLSNIKVNKDMVMEGRVDHPHLYYTGRFDALIELDGALTLVDWKTINKQSTKSASGQPKTPTDLFTNPAQLAAYVAAVNSSPAYAHLPTITNAAVVLAYEDRPGVEVVKMDSDAIQRHFDDFVQRLNKFWWLIEHSAEKGGLINLVYNPKRNYQLSEAK